MDSYGPSDIVSNSCLLGYIRGLKSKGLRLDLIVVAMCTYAMYASNSLNSCANW